MKLILLALVGASVLQIAFCVVCLRFVVDAGARELCARETVFAYERLHNEKRWGSK